MVDQLKEQLESIYSEVRHLRRVNDSLVSECTTYSTKLALATSTITAFANYFHRQKPLIIENPVNSILQAENDCLRQQILQLENIISARSQSWHA